MRKHKIFVVGSLNMDFRMELDRFPGKGETVVGHSFQSACGGKGGNQAIAAARAGADVSFIGSVGNDVFGEELLATLKDSGVDVSSVAISSSPSGSALIFVSGGDNEIAINHGANFSLSEEKVVKALESARPGDLLVVQFEIPLPLVQVALREAKKKGLQTIVNPAPACYPLDSFAGLIDYIIPNESEYALLYHPTLPLLLGSHNLLVTLGERGSRFQNDQESFLIPALRVKAVDSTAAGDTFIGYFVAGLSEGMGNKEAMLLASKAAAICVTRPGAVPSIPYRSEVL